MTLNMLRRNRRLYFWAAAFGLLLIPLIAMQFTAEVAWDRYDFTVAGGLIVGTGLLFELVLRLTRNPRHRLVAGVFLVSAFLVIWAELAVGIF